MILLLFNLLLLFLHHGHEHTLPVPLASERPQLVFLPLLLLLSVLLVLPPCLLTLILILQMFQFHLVSALWDRLFLDSVDISRP